ncbi:MAG TPA: hypothetical protein VF384_10465 [Planctomycetota bacterium]
MNQTPYEMRLRSIRNVAKTLHDFDTLERVERMIELVKEAQYGPLQVQFTYLHPIYRTRIGVPPVSREADQPTGPDPDAGD